jgi:predicted  nucleic acid-binding Zn-ribbon protein
VIEQVEQIRGELEKALDDIHEALHTLEQVEREKTASEEEIETLRETLKQLQHGQGNSRQARYPAQKPTGTTAHEESDSDIERETD